MEDDAGGGRFVKVVAVAVAVAGVRGEDAGAAGNSLKIRFDRGRYDGNRSWKRRSLLVEEAMAATRRFVEDLGERELGL